MLFLFLFGTLLGLLIGICMLENLYSRYAKEGKATTFDGIPYKFVKIEVDDEANE